MYNNDLSAQDSADFGLSAAQPIADGMRPQGVFRMECVGADGSVKWIDEFPNIVVTVGKNDMETQYLKGSAYTAAFFMGLKNTGTALAADTMSSHSSWTENVTFSNVTRPAITWGTASAGVIATSAVSFNINGSTTIFGCFITTNSTLSGTTGTLFSAADAGASRAMINGDTLNVTYTLTLT